VRKSISGQARTSPPKIAWIIPENNNRLHKPGDLQEVDDAPQVLRDALVRRAAEHGCTTTDLRRLDGMVDREFPRRNLTDGQAAGIGARMRAEIVVYGNLDGWARGSLFGSSTTVKFRLDVVDSSGTPLAHLDQDGTAAQEDPSDLADSLAHQVIDSLIGVWGGCGTGS